MLQADQLESSRELKAQSGKNAQNSAFTESETKNKNENEKILYEEKDVQDTKAVAPKKSRPAVPTKTHASACLPVDATPEVVSDGVAAPALHACAWTQPESLNG